MSENTECVMEKKFSAYFASVNHLSKKIISDREQIKSKYGESWYSLSEKERDEIFNNNLINAVVGHQYDNYERQTAFDIPETFPKLVLQTGDRLMVDVGDGENSVSKATGLTWRDEHSAPFSWKTASQIELSFCDEDGTKASGEKKVKIKPTCEQLEECWQSNKSETVYVNPNSSVDTSSVNITSDLLGQISASLAKPRPFATENSNEFVSKQSLSNPEKSQQLDTSSRPLKKNDKHVKQVVRKPVAPPPAPPKQARSSTNVISAPGESLNVHDNAGKPELLASTESGNISIKTGFDFLDNW